ncbi:MAG: bifunctional phosphoglucose/phosphomannose isomerase [Candidatus Staskawiczbacteria bacterium RIFOXYB2_FULL_32_9]|uniref:Bifunctional phosphoglucose/phosphomannose isomerase n=1 Tax=Candidatus Staskawiczbacteria bacterium RIFOXYD1_FULL_32_13 TaxID=1802234 RepID=A0A1G2JNA3_9BACT|nr:MAG: bifunctional phosphoglucose/phosphomannose isomerase [Candidatus Staskawiczbacteria bacterium RIFOXYA2_FULL_32_7]OGZ80875.1 MAG: bifunctional phosphoglucose/phosphomannose isomerase [Candidatus Staskawiczbacteria bacterium RIFOXYB1_FULL_32_11]OGZ84266.1 MAG: bifunctional phosphoglucose/phosphomannose isomerase [Candidatus Staskawiczbacteria bacterium RIFOXYB2_FULL_32_9]OGZ88433.1 MAG: bifunctional phosphoglucose/phosphomannose isomerase [Candidatus Staskawiczbacteria bacterium RIFOXYD1_F
MIIDKQNMRQVIIDSPLQLKIGLDIAETIKVSGDFKNIIFCAIGGSALPINVLNSIIKTTIPIYIHRDYGLPIWADKDSLIICISYSGNTEECLSSLKEAIDKNLKVIVVSSGGKFEELAKQNNIPFAKLPLGIQPRCATGYIFSAITKILINAGILKDISFEILDLAGDLKNINLELEKEGKKIASKITKKVPIVYSSNNFSTVARIWKIKFNENSKIPAFFNYFPELNHNEMVGFTMKNPKFKTQISKLLSVIILRDQADHPRILKRMQLTTKLISKTGIKTNFVEIKKGSLMFKVFSTLLLGDWVSYFVALNQKIDPTPVKMVEDFKKQMSK